MESGRRYDDRELVHYSEDHRYGLPNNQHHPSHHQDYFDEGKMNAHDLNNPNNNLPVYPKSYVDPYALPPSSQYHSLPPQSSLNGNGNNNLNLLPPQSHSNPTLDPSYPPQQIPLQSYGHSHYTHLPNPPNSHSLPYNNNSLPFTDNNLYYHNTQDKK